MLASDPVAIPYAAALVSLAEEQGALLEVRDQVAALLEAFAQEPDGLLVLESPKISAEQKQAIVESAFRGSMHDALTNTLAVVVKRGRGRSLRAVCEETVSRADEALGRVVALAQTATPLDDAGRDTVRKVVNTATGNCTVDGFGNAESDSDDHSVDLFDASVTIDKTGDDW